jgi:hypothetical protein
MKIEILEEIGVRVPILLKDGFMLLFLLEHREIEDSIFIYHPNIFLISPVQLIQRNLINRFCGGSPES